MNVYAIGASRNIGYYAAVRLLDRGATVTFLLRSPSAFDADDVIQKYIKSGKARLVKGDALNADDVSRGWDTALAAADGHLDTVLFTVGGTPHFKLTKGFVINPPDLCTRSFFNVLSTMPAALRDPSSQPKFVVVASNGITHASHVRLPFSLRLFYTALLSSPHADKLALERLIAQCAGWNWLADEDPVDPSLLSSEMLEDPKLPQSGQLRRIVVVHPALLTDGACKADTAGDSGSGAKTPYRAQAGHMDSPYTISRRDVAHFIVEKALQNWNEWEGKRVTTAY